LGASKSRFTYCVELFLFLTVTSVWAQAPAASPSPTPTVTFTFTATSTSTPDPTDTPAGTPTSTPTATYTFNPFASPTWTPTWGFGSFSSQTPTPSSPTATFTPRFTSTPTNTGTLSPTATFTPTFTNTPSISRASLALLSTAYSNAWDRTDGFNWDMGFSYYIGSIVSRDFAKKDIDSLEPSRFALLTSDVKYAWLPDDGDSPAIANGLLLSFLAQLGSGNSTTGANGSQSFQVAGNVMGGVYGVLSKRLFDTTAVHLGYIYGLHGLDHDAGIGFVSMNYSQLLPLLTTKLQDVTGSPAPIFYSGFSTRFWGRNWKFEVLKPLGMDGNPVLLNSQIEGLPLAFNLGFERWDAAPQLDLAGGWALLGYVNFRFTLVPVTPPY